MRARAAELGVDLSAATVLNPQTSELCELFAAQYVELRKKKGVTLEQAGEIIRDVRISEPCWCTTTSSTGWCRVRRTPPLTLCARHSRSSRPSPARVDGVEHLPDVPERSGAGLRRLRDRAGPDRRGTRRHRDQFGADRRSVRHRTPSGHAVLFHRGVGDRSRCRQSPAVTELVRQRIRHCWSRGPIQYDAAVDPTAASAKMPGPEVAGRATVLISPTSTPATTPTRRSSAAQARSRSDQCLWSQQAGQ